MNTSEKENQESSNQDKSSSNETESNESLLPKKIVKLSSFTVKEVNYLLLLL